MKWEHPHIDNTPGLRWRRRNGQWEAIWRARADLVRRGFSPKNRLLWKGHELTLTEQAMLQDECQKLQDEMLIFSRGGLPVVGGFTGTLRSLIDCYQTDPDSTYHKLRFHVRVRHDQMLRRIVDLHGPTELADIKARLVKNWHADWIDNGQKPPKHAIGHAFVGQLRTLFGFGFTLLEDENCERLCAVMGKLRFPSPKPRTERMTFDQVVLLRKQAHAMGWHSIALAQALQFELMLRQKDVVGEWVPMDEPGTSDVTGPNGKWLRGLRWNEIDANLILKHTTSKRGKDLEVDLKLAPMVVEELASLAARDPSKRSGPVIVCEYNDRPWIAGEFRRKWRLVARAAGIPDEVRNMDSRAGAISEATDAGADLEHVRHAATHSNISMTQRYSRGAQEKIANVQRARVAGRNKPGTE